jgi:hypothetical protein
MCKLSYQRLLRARYSFLSCHPVDGKIAAQDSKILHDLLQLPHPDRENTIVLWAETLSSPVIFRKSSEGKLVEHH